MAELFIANPNRQHWLLHYRLPEVTNLQEEVVPAGGQISVARFRKPSEAQLQGILDQLIPIGMIEVKALHRQKGKIGLVYQWGKPIDIEKLSIGIQQNGETALKEADDARHDQAVATMEDLSKLTGAEPESFEVEVSEVTEEFGVKKVKPVRTIKKAAA